MTIEQLAAKLGGGDRTLVTLRCEVQSLARIASMDPKAFCVPEGQSMPTEQEVMELLPKFALSAARDVVAALRTRRKIDLDALAAEILELVG